jgi:hypothetical protein
VTPWPAGRTCHHNDHVLQRPHTTADTALAAMTLAATTDNLVHAQQILLAASTPTARVAEEAREDEGGQLGSAVRQRRPTATTPRS